MKIYSVEFCTGSAGNMETMHSERVRAENHNYALEAVAPKSAIEEYGVFDDMEYNETGDVWTFASKHNTKTLANTWVVRFILETDDDKEIKVIEVKNRTDCPLCVYDSNYGDFCCEHPDPRAKTFCDLDTCPLDTHDILVTRKHNNELATLLDTLLDAHLDAHLNTQIA